MTTPPINDNISKLFLTDTFYSWFLKTNDLIDKVNPISLYGISADVRNPAPDGKNYDGITIADLGEGYYRIGYHNDLLKHYVFKKKGIIIHLNIWIKTIIQHQGQFEFLRTIARVWAVNN